MEYFYHCEVYYRGELIKKNYGIFELKDDEYQDIINYSSGIGKTLFEKIEKKIRTTKEIPDDALVVFTSLNKLQ